MVLHTSWIFGAVAAVTASVSATLSGSSPVLGQDICRYVEFERTRHAVCTFDLRETDLRLFSTDADGRPFGSLRGFVQSEAGRDAVFAMNAGMYHRDLTPVGLHIEDGVEHKAANTNDGPGNFHLKPNGVFYVAGDSAGVMETGAFLAEAIPADLATQSGPMLLIAGEMHPRFIVGSDSLKVRNGVGVRDPHTVVFAMSAGRVNFESFARLFRDALGVEDALYLDGTISSLYAPDINRADFVYPAGPILGAFERP